MKKDHRNFRKIGKYGSMDDEMNCIPNNFDGSQLHQDGN
jgi:hypothetical protein